MQTLLIKNHILTGIPGCPGSPGSPFGPYYYVDETFSNNTLCILTFSLTCIPIDPCIPGKPFLPGTPGYPLEPGRPGSPCTDLNSKMHVGTCRSA